MTDDAGLLRRRRSSVPTASTRRFMPGQTELRPPGSRPAALAGRAARPRIAPRQTLNIQQPCRLADGAQHCRVDRLMRAIRATMAQAWRLSALYTQLAMDRDAGLLRGRRSSVPTASTRRFMPGQTELRPPGSRPAALAGRAARPRIAPRQTLNIQQPCRLADGAQHCRVDRLMRAIRATMAQAWRLSALYTQLAMDRDAGLLRGRRSSVPTAEWMNPAARAATIAAFRLPVGSLYIHETARREH